MFIPHFVTFYKLQGGAGNLFDPVLPPSLKIKQRQYNVKMLIDNRKRFSFLCMGRDGRPDMVYSLN